MINSRVGCSTISFRRLPLADELNTIHDRGFSCCDVGALPGVCDHIPFDITPEAIAEVKRQFHISQVQPVSINGDIGDLNLVLGDRQRHVRDNHLVELIDLAADIDCPALVLPCGSLGHDPLDSLEKDIERVAHELLRVNEIVQSRGKQLWVEHLHSGRLCWNIERSHMLYEQIKGHGIGIVMDLSHIVASGGQPQRFMDLFGDDIVHVHIRDARPGDIHISVGRGEVDFTSAISQLEQRGYRGRYVLELETADVTEAERPQAAQEAGEYISTIIADAA